MNNAQKYRYKTLLNELKENSEICLLIQYDFIRGLPNIINSEIRSDRERVIFLNRQLLQREKRIEQAKVELDSMLEKEWDRQKKLKRIH